MDLRTRFDALWRRLNAGGDANPVFDDLIVRYGEPHRRYHTDGHLRFGLAQLDLVADLADDADAVEFAFFFHDAIYELTARDNEARSADLAAATLSSARVAAPFIDDVRACIRTTAPGSTPASANERVISDIDLAILGQPRDAFIEYERLVREEYASVPEDAFWGARKQILTTFLARPGIYSTERFAALYEATARQNLESTIASH